MVDNPFLADKGQALAMALMSLGGGISQAASAGLPAWSGIGPGVGNFASAMAMAQQRQRDQQQQDELNTLRRRQFDLQEAEFKDKHAERERLTKAAESYVPPGMAAAAATPGTPGMRAPTPLATMGPGADVLGRTKQAIAGNESAGQPNGGYGAVGPDTGKGRAYGKYQVMDFNVGPWTQEALGKAMTPQEFLADPTAQEAVADHKLGQYIQQHGSPDAAARVWFGGPGALNNPGAKDILGTSVAGYADKFNRSFGATPVSGPQIAQGDNVPRADGSGTPQPSGGFTQPPPSPPEVPRPQLPAQDAARIQRAVQLRQITPQQGDAESKQIVADLWNRQQTMATEAWKQQVENWRFNRGQAGKDQWAPLSGDDVKMFPGLDPSKAYQRNRVTGEIKPVGGALVSINNEQQTEFAKEVGKNDAKRLKEIQDAESTMSDFASKIRFATQQLGDTYTGTGAEGVNAWFKALGSMGFEEAGQKANSAAAAQAIISQMKPHMRAAGSGASSDRDMDMFAQALPSLVNLPGGNQRIAGYFDKLSERATEIRRLAEEHSKGGTAALSGTGFGDAVKKLGPLFTEAERKELQDAAKDKPAAATPKQRPSLDSIFKGSTPAMTPRPDLGTIFGAP